MVNNVSYRIVVNSPSHVNKERKVDRSSHRFVPGRRCDAARTSQTGGATHFQIYRSDPPQRSTTASIPFLHSPIRPAPDVPIKLHGINAYVTRFLCRLLLQHRLTGRVNKADQSAHRPPPPTAAQTGRARCIMTTSRDSLYIASTVQLSSKEPREGQSNWSRHALQL